LEAAAARQRLDAQEHLAELPGAARLLLVAVMAFRRAGDGLPVRDLRRPSRDRDAELLLHPLEHEAPLELGPAAQHGLVRLARVLDLQARILRGDLVQGVRKLLLLPASRELYRDAVHRRRQLDRPE